MRKTAPQNKYWASVLSYLKIINTKWNNLPEAIVWKTQNWANWNMNSNSNNLPLLYSFIGLSYLNYPKTACVIAMRTQLFLWIDEIYNNCSIISSSVDSSHIAERCLLQFWKPWSISWQDFSGLWRSASTFILKTVWLN